MLSRFKTIGLKSLTIFTRKQSGFENLLSNKTKADLTQLASRSEYNKKEKQKNESKFFNKTNYLLVCGVFSLAYLNRNHEEIYLNLFKDYFDQFKIEAKVVSKEDEEKELLKVLNVDQQKLIKKNPVKPNIRETHNFIADTVEKSIPSVVQIEVYEKDPYFDQLIKTNSGSGFIVSRSQDNSKSLILTNAHVLGNIQKVSVQLQNGKQLVGHVKCLDSNTDLAFVEIDDISLPVLEFEPSKDIRIGEFVIAIGSPIGFSNSVTAGIVSSTKRLGKDLGLDNDEMEYIQTDASINLGNSGGPLINLDSKVIGILTYTILPNINLAIPADYAIKFLDPCKAISKKQKSSTNNESHQRRFFGITMLTLTSDVLNQLRQRKIKLDNITHGVLLVKVEPNSIADKTGLKVGDIIIEMNQKKSMEAAEVYKTIEENSKLNLIVIRNGDQKIKFNVSFS